MINFLLFILASSIVLANIFYTFPIMGHDFSLVVSWAHDYHFAWNKFNVFNVQFSPQRCLGIPVWANPIGVNFSFFHLISIFFSEIPVIIIFILTYLFAGFYGSKKFISLFDLDNKWSSYLAFSWCLQGSVIMRSLEGHLSYLSILLWPLYAYLILKKYENKKLETGATLLVGLLMAHDFYSGSPPLYLQYAMAFLVMLILLKINHFKISLPRTILKFSLSIFFSVLVILPKVIAIFSFTRNFQRNTSFIDIGLLNGFKYSLLSQLFPPFLDYRQLTGWWYGDWESMNYIFPGLILIIFILIILKPKQYPKLLLSLFIVFLLGTFVSSGIYSDFILKIPVIKSFHVNPRWCIFLSLPFFIITILFLKIKSLHHSIIFILGIYGCALPFLIRDQESLQISYIFQQGMDVEKNKLNYCYEPIFGYRLELFPFDKIQTGKMMDPRCYLVKNGCKEMTLDEDGEKALEQYKLTPNP